MNLILLSFHTIIRFPYSKVNIYIYMANYFSFLFLFSLAYEPILDW
jgi:hypothetical protein